MFLPIRHAPAVFASDYTGFIGRPYPVGWIYSSFLAPGVRKDYLKMR